MDDLVDFRPLAEILIQFVDTDHVVTAVCHGPAGLLSANRPNGGWLFDRTLHELHVHNAL